MPVSIDTNNADRNAHLLRADFDVQNNSDITISGTELIKLDNYNYRLTGVPKMKWINKEVMLDVEFGVYQRLWK